MISHSQKNLNIDIGNKCTLQCSECAREKFRELNTPIPGKDLTIEQFDKISDFFIGKKIHFCGTFSDPIFNPDFIKMLKLCREKNIHAVIHNAASHKSEEWYKEAFESNTDAEWWFGIDGLPNQSHVYRKNQDGEKLFKVMLEAKNTGLKRVTWQYIVFDYNQDSIKAALDLAKIHKLRFLLINTQRAPNKIYFKGTEFKPKCLDNKDLGFSVTGHITPCCWTNTRWNAKYLKDIFLEKNHIDNHASVSDIIQTPEWKKLFNVLINDPNNAPDVCKKMCTISLDKNPEETQTVFRFDED
jgi:MoaA/NifB/PqqE/SkfB family radical SAM enzyme